MESTDGRTIFGMSLHHRPWTPRMVRRRQAWHAIIALGQQKWSNDVRRDMPSPPLESTPVERRWAWHDITTFGQHTRSNYIGRGMTSPPLDCTISRTTFVVACHHCGWAAHTIERRRAWHDITSFGMHAWSDDVGRGITSPPLDSTLGRQRRAWHEITAFGQHTQ